MSSTSIPGLELPSNNVTVGPILVGSAVGFFLYGCTCLQAFIYQQRYPNDRKSVKWGVFILWIIDSFDMALTFHICYFYLVTNYLNVVAIFSPTWSLKLHVFVVSLSDFIVRAMFTRRIYALSHRNLPIALFIGVLSLLDLVIGTVITVKAFKIATFQGLTAVTTLFNVNFATNIVADTCVAACLTYYLWVNRTGQTRTNSLVNKLILYTVTTGLITAIVAALGLITYLTNPTTLIFIAFYLNLSKFYVNSYFASLNVRKNLLSSMHTHDLVSIQLTGATTGGRMPAFRHTDTVTGSVGDEMDAKIVSLNTLGSGTTSHASSGKTAGGASSVTAIDESPTSAFPLTRDDRKRRDDFGEDLDGDKDGDSRLTSEGDGLDVEQKAGLDMDMDADVYRGETDPEAAYTQAHRRGSSVQNTHLGTERRLSFGIGESRRSNASGR